MRRFLDELTRSEPVRFGLLVSTGLVVLTGLIRTIVDGSSGRRRMPAPWAGVLMAVAAWAVMARLGPVPPGITVGLPLLVAAGLFGRRPWEVMMAALPGAVAIVYWGRLPLGSYQPWLVLAIAVASGLVIDFDRAFRRPALGPPFLFISMVGVLITVPDTELAMGLAAVALPLGIAGFPLRMLSLGPGAAATVGLIGSVAGTAGNLREGAFVGVIGALGLMLCEPLGRWLRRTTPTALQEASSGGVRGVLLLGAVHTVLVIGLTRFAGLRQDFIPALLSALPFLAVGAILAAAPGGSRAARAGRGGVTTGSP